MHLPLVRLLVVWLCSLSHVAIAIPEPVNNPSLAIFTLPSLDDTFGAMFIGLLISTGLYGLLCLQCYLCFQQFPDDRFAKWIQHRSLNTLHTIVISHAVYGYLITNFSNPLALLEGTCCITYFVQLVMIKCTLSVLNTLSVTTRNVYYGGLVVILATVQFGSFQLKAFSRLAQVKTTIVSSLAITVACDVIVTGILCFYLNRSRTGFKRTESLINNLMWYSLSTGLLPSTFATLQLITYLAMPNNFVNICISLFVGKLYSNSLLTILNGRASIRAKWELGDNVQEVQLSHLSSANGRRVNAAGKDSVAILVGQTTEIKSDFQPTQSHSLGDFKKYNSESGHHV
ncbi:hypothetical protein BD410DRAFT_796956 [Rickenella mellea]|uniref:DUF6534 domain-containing protein n=1 Tax=Rickenella mellea TaxID=50990 RepID=A0A4Y7PH60_9AGAM|nr:hypothetical protein BD410DRAFT_796956 [Rickenella mellea]